MRKSTRSEQPKRGSNSVLTDPFPMFFFTNFYTADAHRLHPIHVQSSASAQHPSRS